MYAYHHKYLWKFMYFIEYIIWWTSQSCKTLEQFFESLYNLLWPIDHSSSLLEAESVSCGDNVYLMVVMGEIYGTNN